MSLPTFDYNDKEVNFYTVNAEFIAPQVNAAYTLLSGFLVFFMHAGFCMVEVGCVRAKNAKNTVIMTLLDAAFACVGWYATGYAFSAGSVSNAFIGHSNFFMANITRSQFVTWFFGYTFATTATTIVSGAVAERCRFEAYIWYSLWMSMWVYPVVSHWCWAGTGWASAFNVDLLFSSGVYDFAGSGVVHLVGGCASFWAAMALGPRIGRFDGEGKPVDMPGHNMSFFILGVFILWFGWYGFNPGSQYAVMGFAFPWNPVERANHGDVLDDYLGGNVIVTARAAVNTTLGASFGLVGGFFIKMLHEFIVTRTLVWDVMCAGNGTLAGLAAITAGCSVVQPWGAMLIGLMGGVVYYVFAWLTLNVFKVDDPVEACAIHGAGGFWGLIGTALFAADAAVTETYGVLNVGDDETAVYVRRKYGLFMGGGGQLLAANLVFALAILGWVSVFMIPFFFGFKAIGFLRVSAEMERAGLDQSHHGGSAYNMTDFANGPPVVKPVTGGGMNGSAHMEREMEALKKQLAALTSEVRGNGGAKATV